MMISRLLGTLNNADKNSASADETGACTIQSLANKCSTISLIIIFEPVLTTKNRKQMHGNGKNKKFLITFQCHTRQTSAIFGSGCIVFQPRLQPRHLHHPSCYYYYSTVVIFFLSKCSLSNGSYRDIFLAHSIVFLINACTFQWFFFRQPVLTAAYFSHPLLFHFCSRSSRRGRTST